LHLILDQLPLLELIQLKRVCHRLNCLALLACRRRHSLTLLMGRQAVRAIETSFVTIPFVTSISSLCGPENCHLKVLILSKATVLSLTTTFPNITTLNIASPAIFPSELNQVASLLTSWSSKLRTLKLWLGSKPRSSWINYD